MTRLTTSAYEPRWPALDEQVWEKLDALAEAGVCQVGITAVWHLFGSLRGPSQYTATIRVFREAVRAGILDHPARGVYRIVQNIHTATVEASPCALGEPWPASQRWAPRPDWRGLEQGPPPGFTLRLRERAS